MSGVYARRVSRTAVFAASVALASATALLTAPAAQAAPPTEGSRVFRTGF
ncbi:hypothetical protein [Streptomyces sp. NPDC096153]